MVIGYIAPAQIAIAAGFALILSSVINRIIHQAGLIL